MSVCICTRDYYCDGCMVGPTNASATFLCNSNWQVFDSELSDASTSDIDISSLLNPSDQKLSPSQLVYGNFS